MAEKRLIIGKARAEALRLGITANDIVDAGLASVRSTAVNAPVLVEAIVEYIDAPEMRA